MAMDSKFMRGLPLLTGSNTTPGQVLTAFEKEIFLKTLKACSDYGLDYYPTVIQKLTHDEMSEVAAYGGFPRRHPHWKWGMEYERLQKGYEFGLQKIFEMVINCLHPDTLVLTKRGTIKVSQVRIGDEMIVGNESRRVVATKTQRSSKTKTIKLKGLGRPLVCTPNHKWKVIADDGPCWMETKDIKPGDLLIGSDAFHYHQKVILNLPVFDVVGNMAGDHKLPTAMSLHLAELLGCLAGGGFYQNEDQRDTLCLSVPKSDLEYAEHVSKLFGYVFGEKARIETQYHEENESYNFLVEFRSEVACAFLTNLGLHPSFDNFGRKIPKVVWQCSQEYRAAFLRGLFDTSCHNLYVHRIPSNDVEFLSDVQQLLLEMGISCKLYDFHQEDAPLLVSGLKIDTFAGIRKFAERIGFSGEARRREMMLKLQNGHQCNGGHRIPYMLKKVREWIDSQNAENSTDVSIAAHAGNLMDYDEGHNGLSDFIQKALANPSYICMDAEIVNLARMPIFAVESVEEGPGLETVDIALDHDAHDFIAGCFLSHNTNPCLIYVLNSNSLVDNVTVVAHATGHNDFFKNNIRFTPTDQNMMNKLANNGARITKYIERWGLERVTEFIDRVGQIDTLIDVAKSWEQKEIKDHVIKDSRTYSHPRMLHVDDDRKYMYPWVNTDEWLEQERARIAKNEVAKELDLFLAPEKDIFGFIKDHAPLKPWQNDIISMLYEEEMYFAPQGATKTINEGWASFIDYEIMARQGFVGLGQERHDDGIIAYADHKWRVLGGKYSTNPYKLGFYLLLDIEERWNKGRFGDEYEKCKNMQEKENWDKNLGLGKEKVFEVRKYYDDVTFIHEFFTREFCAKHEYFEWKRYPSGEVRLEYDGKDEIGYKRIKHKLLQKYFNRGLPDIRLVDPNHRNKGWMLLQHWSDGRTLYLPYAREVLASLYYLWKREVVLASKDKNGKEIVLLCIGPNADEDVALMSREEYETKW